MTPEERAEQIVATCGLREQAVREIAKAIREAAVVMEDFAKRTENELIDYRQDGLGKAYRVGKAEAYEDAAKIAEGWNEESSGSVADLIRARKNEVEGT